MYSCKQASELASRAMDQPLAPAERLLLRLHLMMCRGCRNFTHQIGFLRRAAHTLPGMLDKDEDRTDR